MSINMICRTISHQTMDREIFIPYATRSLNSLLRQFNEMLSKD